MTKIKKLTPAKPNLKQLYIIFGIDKNNDHMLLFEEKFWKLPVQKRTPLLKSLKKLVRQVNFFDHKLLFTNPKVSHKASSGNSCRPKKKL